VKFPRATHLRFLTDFFLVRARLKTNSARGRMGCPILMGARGEGFVPFCSGRRVFLFFWAGRASTEVGAVSARIGRRTARLGLESYPFGIDRALWLYFGYGCALQWPRGGGL